MNVPGQPRAGTRMEEPGFLAQWRNAIALYLVIAGLLTLPGLGSTGLVSANGKTIVVFNARRELPKPRREAMRRPA